MWKYGQKCCPAETVGLLRELLTSGSKHLEKVKATEKRYRWSEGYPIQPRRRIDRHVLMKRVFDDRYLLSVATGQSSACHQNQQSNELIVNSGILQEYSVFLTLQLVFLFPLPSATFLSSICLFKTNVGTNTVDHGKARMMPEWLSAYKRRSTQAPLLNYLGLSVS